MTRVAGNRVRVLVADDSPLVRNLYTQAFATDASIEVVGTAQDGEQAIALTHKHRPDVLVLDASMPKMDGLDAAARIMAERPTPILMVTADVDRASVEATKRALSLGILALQLKPSFSSAAGMQALIDDVKLLASVRVVRHRRLTKLPESKLVALAREKIHQAEPAIEVVGIVSSTGGPALLKKLLLELPPSFPFALLLVQHISHAFAQAFVEWLGEGCDFPVRTAREGEKLAPGTVLCAPPDYHLDIDKTGRVRLSDEASVDGHRPSGSVLLSSLAKRYGPKAVGIVLTGMGEDGARGLLELSQAGGVTAAQSSVTCAVYGMPAAAFALGSAQRTVDGEGLSSFLAQICGS
jgi:two-component system, chemotaxis family, protein-glutamate methylesterase/glutaminase